MATAPLLLRRRRPGVVLPACCLLLAVGCGTPVTGRAVAAPGETAPPVTSAPALPAPSPAPEPAGPEPQQPQPEPPPEAPGGDAVPARPPGPAPAPAPVPAPAPAPAPAPKPAPAPAPAPEPAPAPAPGPAPAPEPAPAPAPAPPEPPRPAPAPAPAPKPGGPVGEDGGGPRVGTPIKIPTFNNLDAPLGSLIEGIDDANENDCGGKECVERDISYGVEVPQAALDRYGVTTAQEYFDQTGAGPCAIHTLAVVPIEEGGVTVGARVVAKVAADEGDC